MSIEKEKIIQVSKAKLALVTLGAFGFVILGGWMLSISKDFGSKEAFIGTLCIVVFGSALIMGMRTIFDHSPGLILNEEGFIVKSRELIRWSEVTEITEVSINGSKMIGICVQDPWKYIDKGNFFQRQAALANYKLSGASITITATTLKISHKELLEEFVKYLGSSR